MYARTERAGHILARLSRRADPGRRARDPAAGTRGFVTQALGGSFTVYIEGNLFRIAGADGDAIGKEPLLAAGCAR